MSRNCFAHEGYCMRLELGCCSTTHTPREIKMYMSSMHRDVMTFPFCAQAVVPNGVVSERPVEDLETHTHELQTGARCAKDPLRKRSDKANAKAMPGALMMSMDPESSRMS